MMKIDFNYKIFITAILIIFGILFFSFNIIEAADFYQVDPAGATVEVDEHTVCQMVTNNGSLVIFVPTKTPSEWAEFRIHHPSNVSLSDCAPDCECDLGDICCSDGCNFDANGTSCGNCGSCSSTGSCESQGVCAPGTTNNCTNICYDTYCDASNHCQTGSSHSASATRTCQSDCTWPTCPASPSCTNECSNDSDCGGGSCSWGWKPKGMICFSPTGDARGGPIYCQGDSDLGKIGYENGYIFEPMQSSYDCTGYDDYVWKWECVCD